MKHKLSEMIKAKADNMDLVIIVKNLQNDGVWWALKSDKEILPSFSTGEYFACLPQHKEACLHWLNGGEVQQSLITNGSWIASADVKKVSWMPWTSFMKDELKFRIKPKKEKRWILVNHETNCTSMLYDDEQIALGALQEEFLSWQIIEIEVDV